MAEQAEAVGAQRIYLLHGDDAFSRDEQVRGLKARMLAGEAGAFNLNEFEVPAVRAREVILACDSFPFLAGRRLVIVRGLFSTSGRGGGARRGGGESAGSGAQEGSLGPERAALLEHLPRLPDFTALVLAEGRLGEKQLAALREAVPAGRLFERGFASPRPEALPGWIEARARRRGGQLGPGVARRLAELGPGDLALIENELAKLLTYRDGETVLLEDVELLAADGELSHFRLLDAVLAGDRAQALGHWRRLLRQGVRPEALLPLLAGSLRALLVAAEARVAGVALGSVAAAQGITPARVPHLQRQAARFNPARLEEGLRALLDLDRRVKRGEAELEVGLEVLVSDLAGLASKT